MKFLVIQRPDTNVRSTGKEFYGTMKKHLDFLIGSMKRGPAKDVMMFAEGGGM